MQEPTRTDEQAETVSTAGQSGGAFTRFTKKAARAVANRLRQYGAGESDGFDISAVPSADVALYFADTPHKLYQLTQWLPVFEERDDVRTIVVVRSRETFEALGSRTGCRSSWSRDTRTSWPCTTARTSTPSCT